MKLLVTGVTGYLGGSVARHLITKGHVIVGLVRTEEQAKQVSQKGMEPFLADLDEHAPILKILQEVDGVVHCASSDHVFFVMTVLEGLRGTGKVFVHTSGSSIVADKAAGRKGERISHEGSYSHLPERAGRVAVDQAVLRSAQENIRSIVICPTMIYGKGLGIKKESIQIPLLLKTARETGGAKHIGPGENIWSNVHIEDLVELYSLAIEKAPSGSFFFAENGEESLAAISRSINRALGIARLPESISLDKGIEYWGLEAAHLALGSNSRVTAEKARALLGWQPKHNSIHAEGIV